MKKPEILIGDFIRYNSASLNNMTTSAPEIATAFAAVMKQLAVKYGNITLPGQTAISTTKTEKELVQLTKDIIASEIIGDVIELRVQNVGKETYELHVIVDVKFKDTFNNTFTVEISAKELTRDPKDKNKIKTFNLTEYKYYFLQKYSNDAFVNENLFRIDKVYKKRTNIRNLLSSLPVFKFKETKVNQTTDYIYTKEGQWSTFNNAATEHEKVYQFRAVDEDKYLYLTTEEVIKMVFNEGFRKQIPLMCHTFLLPVLVKQNLYQPKPSDLIGIKILQHERFEEIAGGIWDDEFYTITEVTKNNPKNKTFTISKTSSSKSLEITAAGIPVLLSRIIEGSANLGSGSYFITSPFEDCKPTEFLDKFRTYSRKETENIFTVFDVPTYINTISTLFSEKSYSYSIPYNKITNVVYNNYENSINVKKLVTDNISFYNSYYNGKSLGFKLFEFVRKVNTVIYKNGTDELQFNQNAEYLQMFTILPDIPIVNGIISKYEKPEIHYADTLVNEKTVFMRNLISTYFVKNPIDTRLFNEMFEIDFIDLINETLTFKYIEYGLYVNEANPLYKTISFSDFVERLKSTDYVILTEPSTPKEFNDEIGKVYFNIDEKVLIQKNSTSEPAVEVKIVSRNASGNVYGPYAFLKITTEENGQSVSYDAYKLFDKYNPYNLKTGDKVDVDERYRKFLDDIFIEQLNSNRKEGLEIIRPNYNSSSFFVSISQEFYNNNRHAANIDIRYLKPLNKQQTGLTPNTVEPTQPKTEPKTQNLKISSLPGLEIYPVDVRGVNSTQAKGVIDAFNSPVDFGWRFPTKVEMGFMLLELLTLDIKGDEYWVSNGTEIIDLNLKTRSAYNDSVAYLRMVKGEYSPATTAAPSAPSAIKFPQSIPTIPSLMTVDFNFKKNDGQRDSPTQGAGDLKRYYKNTKYESEILNTYFMGNDNDWYKIDVLPSGVWKWKKEDLKIIPEPTVNRDYASMTQEELKQREKDIKIALEIFDEEDDEYKEYSNELDLIDLYIKS